MKVVMKVVDENGELMILSCLRDFEDDCRIAFATEN